MTGQTFYEYISNILRVHRKHFLSVVAEKCYHVPSRIVLRRTHFALDDGVEQFLQKVRTRARCSVPECNAHTAAVKRRIFSPFEDSVGEGSASIETRDNGERIKRENFAQLLQEALETLDVKTILKNGFGKTGLHPFSADEIIRNI